MTFIDEKCVFKIQDKEFESGGAFIGVRKDTGKLAGIVYANFEKRIVQNWHGDKTFPASFGPEWISNMGDKRRAVYFKYEGRRMFGMWCSTDWSEFVRVREIRG